MSPGPGAFDARYLAFLETVTQLRPKLHRYCARMTGSVMDGEDAVQEALFNAYRRLSTLQEGRPLTPWLFQIAHNRCVDFIRGRQVRARLESQAAGTGIKKPENEIVLGEAIEHLVFALPPKERACVLLNDVLDYSLEEAAEITGSTTGAVKSALHRARAKLAKSSPREAVAEPRDPELLKILRLYVERFNRQDWDAVRELIAADANLLVADRFFGPLSNAPYFRRYAALDVPWRFEAGMIDREAAIIGLRLNDGQWVPQSAARVEVQSGKITRLVDFTHCGWVLSAAQSVVPLRA